MRRLYYLTRNVDSTARISKDLHEAGISNWHFHVLSRDEAGLERLHVHQANPLQRFDIIHSGERGGLIGAVIGLIVGLLAISLTPVGDLWGIWFLPLPTFLFGFFGAWVGGMIGLSHENYKIARFHDDIEAGQYLIMVDIRKGQEWEVRDLMQNLHAEATPAGVDSTWISPFGSGPQHSVYEGHHAPGHIEAIRN